MTTVTIDGNDYDVLADLDAANEFLAADFSADLWRAESDPDKQKRALVSATRLLNRLPWASNRDWPRPGTDDEQDEDVPQPIIDASIILAKLIHAGSKVDSSPSTLSGNIKRQQAGSVSIEYFSPTDDPTRLPVEVLELVGSYLGGATISGARSYGTCGESITDRGFETGWEAP
jgi:hypothetical protein